MSNDVSQNLAVESGSVYTYKELNVDKLKHEYEITVDCQHIKQEMNSELQKIAQSTKLPGFRVGKASYELIVKNYSNEALERILNNLLESCADDLMKKIEIKSHIYPKIDIVSYPNLYDEGEKSDFVYRLSFELMPEVPMIDLEKICLTEFEVPIEDSDVIEFIDSLKTKNPNFLAVSDPSYQAKIGDRLTIDFEGRIRGKLFKGGSNKNSTVNLGLNALISGFDDHLIGMKIEDKKVFKLQFPEDYEVKPLAGQEADFSVQVNKIEIIKNFENDDEIAKNMGFADYSSCIQHMRAIMDDEHKSMVALLVKKQLLDYLSSDYDFSVPINIVEQEHRRIQNEQSNSSYTEAERRVKLAMLFIKFSTEYAISVTQDDTFSVLANYCIIVNVKFGEVLKYFRSNKQFQELVQGQALENKVIDYILERVRKEHKTISVKELKDLLGKKEI